MYSLMILLIQISLLLFTNSLDFLLLRLFAKIFLFLYVILILVFFLELILRHSVRICAPYMHRYPHIVLICHRYGSVNKTFLQEYLFLFLPLYGHYPSELLLNVHLNIKLSIVSKILAYSCNSL